MSTWCSKHVEAWNKLIIKFSASSWLILIHKCLLCLLNSGSRQVLTTKVDKLWSFWLFIPCLKLCCCSAAVRWFLKCLSIRQLVQLPTTRRLVPVLHRLTCVLCDVGVQLLQPVKCEMWHLEGGRASQSVLVYRDTVHSGNYRWYA